MRQLLQRIPRPLRAICLAVVLVFAIDSVASTMSWCDGAYHRFQIPDDYDGGGCSRIIGEWHGVFPWNSDRMEMVCLGLCPPGIPLWTPEK